MTTLRASLTALCCLGGVLLASMTAGAADVQLTGDRVATAQGDLVIHPINHATLALGWNKLVIYADPVGDAKRYEGLPRPDVILLTDIHGDHLSAATLKLLSSTNTILVAPASVASQLPAELKAQTTVLTNGESKTISGIKIDAIPMYNTTPERKDFHVKGRGNGYVLTLGDKRVYLSGDTEDIPEMRSLKKIDVAFLCMNLPYTMTVDQAASAAREFKPAIVYPYHCKGSDLEKFKKLVGTDAGVEVRIRDWYQP